MYKYIKNKIDVFIYNRKMHNLYKNSRESQLLGRCICARCVQKYGGMSYDKMLRIAKIVKQQQVEYKWSQQQKQIVKQ